MGVIVIFRPQTAQLAAHTPVMRLLLAIGFLLLAAGGLAAQPNPVREGFFPGDAAAPQAVIYHAVDARLRFTLDRSNPRQPLLRFEGEDEVLALRVTQGPRGDQIFRTDTDRVVLRLTGLGGATVYAAEAPEGAPAEMRGAGQPILPPRAPVLDLRAVLETASTTLRRKLGRAITVRAPADLPAPYVAEAARRVTDAVDAMIVAGRARDARRVRSVVFESAQRPFAALAGGGQLRVGVAPSLSFAGRPSSEAIRRAIEPPLTARR